MRQEDHWIPEFEINLGNMLRHSPSFMPISKTTTNNKKRSFEKVKEQCTIKEKGKPGVRNLHISAYIRRYLKYYL